MPGRLGLPGPLLRRASLRHILRHPWQNAMTFLAIALGVMMVVAVDLANNSARRALALSLDSLDGDISHQIVGAEAGVADELFVRLRRELGLRASAPAVSGELRLLGRDFTLVGVDPLSELALQRQRPGLAPGFLAGNLELDAFLGPGHALAMSRDTAAALGLQAGQRLGLVLPGGEREARLAALLPASGAGGDARLLWADIASAQELLGRVGRLDSIDLKLDARQAASLRDWLPGRYRLVETADRQRELTAMSESFHVNLLAMSLLALLVAALLIYNAMSLAVLRRRATLGTFRALGLEGRALFGLVLAEAALLGLLASLAGLAAGYLLGRELVTLVTRTVDDLYFQLSITRFQPDPLSLFKGLALGLGVSLLATMPSAWEAARSPPPSLQREAGREQDWQARLPRLALGGLAVMALGLAVLAGGGGLWAGFLALTLLVFGFCLLVPALLYAVLPLLLKLPWPRGGPGSVLRMALRAIRGAIGRSGLAVAALCVALSVTVGVGVMIFSFRGSVVSWLDHSLAGDILVSADQALPDDLSARLAALPAVAASRHALSREVESSAGPLRLQASPAAAAESFQVLEARQDMAAAYLRGEGVLLAEAVAWREGLAPGDHLRLWTPRGPRDFEVLATFRDYSTDRGLVAMHERLYTRWWGEYRPDRLNLWAQPSLGAQALSEQVRAVVDELPEHLRVVSNSEIRALTLRIFDRTFAITHVLRLLAVLVAFAGVLSALMALQLERLREYALLRATGMTGAQVGRLVLTQSALMGLCAGLLALPLGLMMAEVLIEVVNRRAFGWGMSRQLPAGVLLEALLLGLGAALLAGLYPAWRAAVIEPARALREE